MRTFKLIAVNVDGVLLKDTFSPVIYILMQKAGVAYTRDVERNIFSQTQNKGAEYCRERLGVKENEEEMIKRFFDERKKYINDHNSGIIEGVPEFLEMIKSLGIKMVCYGGLEKEYILEDLSGYIDYFDRYVCTNQIRPGIKEITKDIYGLAFDEALFIDDVNTVAETAKKYGVPFIGVPSKFQWSWQKKDMMNTGVKYIVDSVRDIDCELLEKVDEENHNKTLWEKKEGK